MWSSSARSVGVNVAVDAVHQPVGGLAGVVEPRDVVVVGSDRLDRVLVDGSAPM
jgi:hypothetical protein